MFDSVLTSKYGLYKRERYIYPKTNLKSIHEQATRRTLLGSCKRKN